MSEAGGVDVRSLLRRERNLIERGLEACLKDGATTDGLAKAMRYSLMVGGKRLRPILCLASAGMFGLCRETVLPFALGLEFIHTYSLIHDDLPCMDDDDLRRGMPSCHRQFNECTAVLAGDALLTDAFKLMAGIGLRADGDCSVPASRVLAAVALVANAAGSAEMVGGQFLDMLYTGRGHIGQDELLQMQRKKTGAMLKAACVSGALLAGAEDGDLERMGVYGLEIGAAFQIADDILDVEGEEKKLGKPVGSDKRQDKVTWPSLVGLERSRELAKGHVRAALDAVRTFSGPDAELLRALAVYIIKRDS